MSVATGRAPVGAAAQGAGGAPTSGLRAGIAYGALGLPLAFVALPLYVVLPSHYATVLGVPLAALGVLLLAARLLDAFADPWIGRRVDAWFAHSTSRVLAISAMAAIALAASFCALFFPPVRNPASLLIWCGALLTTTYLSYSVLSVVHQAWGARLGGNATQRARVVAWREGLALIGVLVASVLPALAGLGVTSAVFAIALSLGVALLAVAPRSAASPSGATSVTTQAMRVPLANPAFRRLLLVFMVNGVASALPATLVLFFIRDRLQLPAYEPLFLFAYFAAGAASMPLWVRAVARFGLARLWLAGMALAVAAFVWAAMLASGDLVAFTAICIASGLALGADLALPSSLLAGVIQRAGHGGRAEGAYFGWWNFSTKLNLALAAGLALPLLSRLGYTPGTRDADALLALALAYGLVPCVLKLLAGALLIGVWRHAPHGEHG